MIDKKRWQQLAGIKPTEKSKKEEESLNEGFTNFGMANPGVLGNPFEGRMSSLVVEQDFDMEHENYKLELDNARIDTYTKWQDVFEEVGFGNLDVVFHNVEPAAIDEIGRCLTAWLKNNPEEYDSENDTYVRKPKIGGM